MSASSKKKIRNAEAASKMTERQQQEQKEAKKLKLYSTVFVVILALMLVFAAYTVVSNAIASSGTKERSTVAMTVGDQQISSAELSFFYLDAVNKFYAQYGSYAGIFGLDVTMPLNMQVIDEETGKTWADDFLESAKTSAQTVYALNAEAQKAGFTLGEADLAAIDAAIEDVAHHAKENGFSNATEYVKAIYGKGADEDMLRAYYTATATANGYQNEYAASLTYDDAAIQAGDAEHPQEYSSYNYNVYSVAVHDFIEHTTNEDGTESHDHSDEDQAAAEAEAEAVAKELAEAGYTTAEEFDAAIAALPMNAEKENAASTKYEDVLYDNVTALIRDWVSSADRKAGDMTFIANESTTTDPEGVETTTVSSYYVVLYGSSNDNRFPLDNVRHILVNFEGGTVDENGSTVYSDTEKAAAEAKAGEILNTWKNGDATEESFIELAKTESDDTGSAAEGGLIADIYPDAQLVPSFLNWSIDESRKPGDTDIVESVYGYHVMFYSGESEKTYRNFMIENDLRTADYNVWMEQLRTANPITVVNTDLLPLDLILSMG